MSVKKSGRSKARARVVWDEDNLDYLDATKSPKKKITEPKTPYHAPEDSDGTISPLMDDGDEGRIRADSAVDAEAVKTALSQVASSSNVNGKRWRKSSGWTSSEDETEEEHRRFEELRRAHYDEFRKLKLLRSQGSAWIEEDEEQPAEKKSQESQLADAVCAIDIQASTGTPTTSMES